MLLGSESLRRQAGCQQAMPGLRDTYDALLIEQRGLHLGPGVLHDADIEINAAFAQGHRVAVAFRNEAQSHQRNLSLNLRKQCRTIDDTHPFRRADDELALHPS